MDLHVGPLFKEDRPFSAAASVYISREAQTTRHQSTEYLRTRRELETLHETCTARALLFYTRHSTIDPSLLHLKTASETQNCLSFSYWVPEHQGPREFMRSDCMRRVLVSCIHTNLHTSSGACALVFINVCAGYMCFVKL